MIIYEYFLISVIFYLRLTLPGFNLKISIVRVDLDTQIAVGCPTSPAKSTAKLKSKSEKIGPMRNVALYAHQQARSKPCSWLVVLDHKVSRAYFLSRT